MFEVGLKFHVGQDVGLWQSIHGAVAFHRDVTIESDGGEIMVRYNGVEGYCHLNTRIFKLLHGGAEVKILMTAESYLVDVVELR